MCRRYATSIAETMYCYRHPDRETGLSCSECGRPICVDCMTSAPVGIRCPDHSGKPRGSARVAQGVRRAGAEGTGAIVTRTLIAINVAVYLLQLAEGAGINADRGTIFEKGVLFGPWVADGDWWRLITAAFLHYGPIHLGLNMLALWWFGGVVEQALGRGRFLLLYLVSGLAGSAGALLADPGAATVGASGAVFGMLGALLILEWQATGSFTGQAMTLIVINLAFSFAVAHISWGGHLGGLAGGILGTLALARFGRGHAAYGRLGLVGMASLVAIGIASIAIAYWKVRGLA
jgi:membrane associated rhomboid family serine protease